MGLILCRKIEIRKRLLKRGQEESAKKRERDMRKFKAKDSPVRHKIRTNRVSAGAGELQKKTNSNRG